MVSLSNYDTLFCLCCPHYKDQCDVIISMQFANFVTLIFKEQNPV